MSTPSKGKRFIVKAGKVLVAAGAAAVLCIGLPLNAQAATGSFEYTTDYGQATKTLSNPNDGQCYTVGGRTQGEFKNNTDRDVLLYVDNYCRGEVVATYSAGEV